MKGVLAGLCLELTLLWASTLPSRSPGGAARVDWALRVTAVRQ